MECLAATGGTSFALTLVLLGVGVVAIAAGLLMARRGRRAAATLVFVLALGLSLSSVAFGSVAPASAAASCEDPGLPTVPNGTPSSSPSATPTPTPTTVACPVSDKSATLDADGDGVADACDLDSDNDGILDAEEDTNANGLFEDDDSEGVLGPIAVLGDGRSSYLDLDSDNDGILDLMEGRLLTRAQIDAFDSDHNGIFETTLSFGTNGLLDELETAPDSGVLKPNPSLRNTDSDDKPDYLDLDSNGADFDLWTIGRSELDFFGVGFITPIVDADVDGIMDTDPAGAAPGVDTDSSVRGAPGSPYSPYSS